MRQHIHLITLMVLLLGALSATACQREIPLPQNPPPEEERELELPEGPPDSSESSARVG